MGLCFSIKILKLKSLLIIFFLSFFGCSTNQSDYPEPECFMILAGKNATASGQIMLAHNNDLSGIEESFLEIIPACNDTGLTKINYPTGLTINLSARTYRWIAQRIKDGFAEGDAVGINENGVAIAGGVALKKDRNIKAAEADPLIEKGLSGGIRYDVLARSRTAKECVKMLGELYSKYGVSYPSGVGIADSNEVWYIECGGGRHWAAVRIPDSCFWLQANGYRIGEIDTTNKNYFLTSPNLLEFCKSNGLWNPEKGPLNFAKAFGGGRVKDDGGLNYDRLRIWRALYLLSPSMNPTLHNNQEISYPKPEKLIDEKILFNILRDYYTGTEYDKTLSCNDSLRSIACWRGVHSSLIVITPDKPLESHTFLWSGLGSSFVTGFIPIPFGVNSLPDSYSSSNAFNLFFQLSININNDFSRIKNLHKLLIETENNFLYDIRGMKNRDAIPIIELNNIAASSAKKMLEKIVKFKNKLTSQ